MFKTLILLGFSLSVMAQSYDDGYAHFPPLKIGTGAYGNAMPSPLGLKVCSTEPGTMCNYGWPFKTGGQFWQKPNANQPTLGLFAQGTVDKPVESHTAAVSIYSNSFGQYTDGDPGLLKVLDSRTNGTPNGSVFVGIAQSAGYGAGAIQGHTVMFAGTAEKHASTFPLWLNCRMYSRWDACSNEINVTNISGFDPPGDGSKYGGEGYTNGLALIVGKADLDGEPQNVPASASQALYIGTQDIALAPWLTGIEFQNNSVRNWPLILPNEKWVAAWNRDGTRVVPLLSPTALGDVMMNAEGWFYFMNQGRITGYLDSNGDLHIAGKVIEGECMPGQKCKK